MPGGDSDDERGGDGAIDRLAGVNALDVSMAAVNARLRAFITGHREAQARGEERAFRESDVLLASWIEDALTRQEAAELKLAEVEREALQTRGGRVQ